MIEITRSRATLTKIIESASQFLWIVAFQLSDDHILHALIEKQRQGVDVRILTLPIDSFGDSALREHLSQRHQQLHGIQYCRWEVGDPSLTSSSRSGVQRGGGGDKWYSLHGKFIVSDKSALALSANLDGSNDWEVFFNSELPSSIQNFKNKYEELVERFCQPSIQNPIVNGRLFDSLNPELQEKLRSENRLLVPQYPVFLIPNNVTLADRLYISPFDVKARNLLSAVIEQADERFWIAGETLTDQDVVNQILGKKYQSPQLDVRVIVGSQLPRDPSKQASMRENIIQLDSMGIEFRLVDDWHAKIWISDSVVVLGSANLNPINLGIRCTHNEWKANTEILAVSRDLKVISMGQTAYGAAFEQGKPALRIYYAKAERDVSQLLKALNIKARPASRNLLGHVATALYRKRLVEFKRVLQFAQQIQFKSRANTLEPVHVAGGVILWSLEKVATPSNQLRAMVLEIAGPNTDFESAMSYLRDSLEVVQEDGGVASLNALKMFPLDK